jgi:hypothetical protein
MDCKTRMARGRSIGIIGSRRRRDRKTSDVSDVSDMFTGTPEQYIV